MPDCAGSGRIPSCGRNPVWIDEHACDGSKAYRPSRATMPNTKQLLRIVDGKAEWEC